MTTPASRPDQAAVDEFAGSLLTVLNHGSLCLMLSVGHRTGLFDVMSGLPPSTSDEIAAAAGLNERYVREWLGAMATGRVLEVDGDAHFWLPPAHAASLTREAGAANMAPFAQYIAVLGSVEDDIVDCFRRGGGVPYSRFGRFHEVMAEDSGQSVMSSLESHILPLVPGLAERLGSGIDVLDVGCGRGRILNRLAVLFPESRFVGMDLSRDAIDWARTEAASAGSTNVSFVEVDLSDFHASAEPSRFDFVTTFDAIHDQAQPLNVLKGIRRTLRPGGIYLMQDIGGSSHVQQDVDHPMGPFLYTISCMHCMTVSLAQGGEGLGAMWGEATTREYLERAGFSSVVTHKLSHDIQNNWYVVAP